MPSSAPPPILVGGSSQYATIQQGIAAAELAGSHDVVVAPGTYSEADTLSAADSGLTIAAAAAGVTLVGSFALSGAAGITIPGLTFQGDGSTIAISALGGTGLTITQDSFAGTGARRSCSTARPSDPVSERKFRVNPDGCACDLSRCAHSIRARTR